MVTMDNIVVPSVNATALSESPLNWSEKVEASPAVGIANAIKQPNTISETIQSLAKVARTTSKSATITTGKRMSFTAAT